MDYVTFSIIIDDIVFHDGRTCMGVIGGGGPQTAFGMRLWADSVGISAGVGKDLPPSVTEWMHLSGVDERGLRESPTLPTLRAWQVMEEDGRRTQVFRMPGEAIMGHDNLNLNNLPNICRHARGYHIGIHPDEIRFDFLEYLAQQGSMVSVEPFKPADHRLQPEIVKRLLNTVEVFSPNALEASSMIGEDHPLGLLRTLVDLGAKIIALRMGAEGSLIVDGRTHKAVKIPAVPVKVVDPVGAGNAFCGGFLVGWSETHDLATAGLYGAVAASFLVEQVGVPTISETARVEAQRRLAQIREDVQTIMI